MRLELSGFGPFVAPAVVDFEGAELFALTGATGSGKTSILDAISFALYGSVPRHRAGEVAPVITQRGSEAKVRLDFTVRDRSYTAARVVRRLPRGKGANTDEARFESGTEVSDGADEVTKQVEALLGLSYEQFTKCVLLPQGEFARFLQDQSARRKDLLVALLELGIYQRVAQLATQRQKLAEGSAKELEAQLGRLAEATPEALAQAEAVSTALDVLLAEVDAAIPQLERLEAQEKAAVEEHGRLSSFLARLAGVAPPRGFEELAEQLMGVRKSQAEARSRLEAGERDLEARRGRIRELPAKAELVAAVEGHHRLGAERKALADAATLSDQATARLGEARRREAETVAAKQAAESTLSAVQDQHAAAHLHDRLQVGEPCPVCGQEVLKVPSRKRVGKLDSARRAVENATAVLAQALSLAREAEAAQAAAARLVEERARRAGELEVAVDGGPAATDVLSMLDELTKREGEAALAQAGVDSARRSLADADAALAALAEAEREARRSLQSERDHLAALDPPLLDFEDLAADWARLTDWAASTRPELEGRAECAGALVEESRHQLEGERERLHRRCREAGVEVAGRRVRDAVIESLTRAEALVTRLASEIEQAAALRKHLEGQREAAFVAKALARNLDARGFESWVLAEAFEVLVAGANFRLSGLAGGQYSLALDRNLDFEVVDHHAADERRSVRSLSGGETFLVSLALALSLADRLFEMSATGSARVESIFLDEGFGALDSETLDTVAGVIHEIGSAGKTVGFVTHVRELAEQAPVRFVITKDARTAHVVREES